MSGLINKAKEAMSGATGGGANTPPAATPGTTAGAVPGAAGAQPAQGGMAGYAQQFDKLDGKQGNMQAQAQGYVQQAQGMMGGKK